MPALVEALERPTISPEDRSLLIRNLGRLDRTAVPPLLAVLDSGNPRLQANAATALGQIGDPRAVAFLTYPAAAAEFSPEVREAAQAAIGRLTSKPFVAQPLAPAQVLTDAAWQFHRHQVEFPGEQVAVWTWDKDRRTPVSRPLKRAEAEAYFGERLARQAVQLQPTNVDAQAAATSLSLDKAIGRVGLNALPTQDRSTFDKAMAAGPAVLTTVLRKAAADGKDQLAAAAATALGQITDRNLLSADGHPHPLVEALFAPGARVQFAAARALVDMQPTHPFPGSSRVAPVLARFVTAQRPPRAVIIDANASRGSQLSGSLRALGYETVLETSGDQGFRAAIDTVDVELIFVSHALSQSSWTLTDVLSNLKSDSRTAALPVYVYGPGDLEVKRPNLLASFPGVKFLVQPLDAPTLEKLIGGRPASLSDADRAGYAKEATALLARIASQPTSPFTEGLNAVEPALAIAMSQPETSLSAATALGDLPSANAQRRLADAVLDPSLSANLRRNSAARLAHSIKRFGALVSADQEKRLAGEMEEETETELRTSLGTVVDALRAQAPTARRGKPSDRGPAAPVPGATVPANPSR